MIMNQSQFKKLQTSLAILSKWLVPRMQVPSSRQRLYLELIQYWQGKLTSFVSNYGVKHACRRAKLIRALTLSYLAGNPKRVVREFVKINKKGLPGDLGPLQTLAVNGDDVDHRFLLTLLSVSKCLMVDPDPDYSPIENPSTWKTSDWSPYVTRFLRWKKIRKGSLKVDFSQYHLSTKTSPGGGGALGDSLGEVHLLKRCMSLFESICLMGGKALSSRLQALSTRLKDLPEPDTLRRIAAISDKEGKTRVVAILDYWSQTALLPLHNALLGVLRSLKSDMTFNQDGFKNCLRSGPYYSFDLKDATDRFPIALQQQVISYLIGEERAAAWAAILIQEGYKTPNGRTAFYRAGQPMGAYSSWAAFALTHHLVVQRAAMETQKFPFTNYALLGDDIVICDHAVAKRYKELMLELGVEFSDTKTLVSEDTFEFASRFFRRGIEISPFSLKGVLESSKHPASIVEFLRTMASHGWDLLTDGNVPGQIRSLMRLTGSPAFARWNKLIDVFYHVPMQVLLSRANEPLTGPTRLLSELSCFPSQHIPIIRDALIEGLRERVEERIDEITELHAEWAMTVSPPSEYIRSDAGDMPISPFNIPMIGVWLTLERQASDLCNEISVYYEDEDLEYPLDKWISDLVGISNTPDVSKVLSERKHAKIILTSSSLILRALNRARERRLARQEQGE